jgi:1,4-dihydroxy-2-naphthoate polyprenyltransferase
VIKYRLFSSGQLHVLGTVSIVLSICLAALLTYRIGLLVLLFLAIGVWAALAYTCPPLRLAYRPLLGEWLAAWPAMVACTTGTSFLLTGTIPLLSWWAACIHATYSIAWLMQHHIPDISADLTANPVKNTTVAYLCEQWGWPYVTIPGAFYFLLVIFLGLYGITLHYGFAISIMSGILGMILTLTTDPRSISNITRNQMGMIAVSCFHSCLLALSFIA